MNKKRAIITAIGLYIATFLIGIIISLSGGLNFSDPSKIPPYFWFVSLIITIGFSAFASLWYFNSSKTARNTKEGFLLGIIFVVTGFILDLLFFIPVFFKSGNLQNILIYYTRPIFFASLILVVATTTLMGSIGNGESKNKSLKKSSKK